MAPPTQQMDKFHIKSIQVVWKIYTHQYGCACFVCCTHVCIHWYMHMRRLEEDSGYSLSLSNLILETGFLTESERHFLSRLVAAVTVLIFCPPCPQYRGHRYMQSCPAFTWLVRIGTLLLIFTQQALHLLRHLPSLWFLKFDFPQSQNQLEFACTGDKTVTQSTVVQLPHLLLMVILRPQEIKTKWEKCDFNYNQYLNPLTLIAQSFTGNFSKKKGKRKITKLTMHQTVIWISSLPPHNNPIRQVLLSLPHI